MPVPRRFELRGGFHRLSRGIRLEGSGARDPLVREAAGRFLTRLASATRASWRFEDGGKSVLRIEVDGTPSRWPRLGQDESYRLDVSEGGILLHAPEPVGAVRGLSTLLQLGEPGASGVVVPSVVVEDGPRFPWRGLLIDPARRFLPVSDVLRILDSMEVVKLNVLHWHLTDDQGFRVESRRFPELHRRGSGGRYYTQEEIRSVVEAARLRGIRVVPEFDVPGHATSWFAGMPQLASEEGPFFPETSWGIFDAAMHPGREEVYQVLDGFLGEMAELFPDEYIHVGGDEVNGASWERSPSVRAFRKSRGLGGRADLQAVFARRLLGIVQSHGRRMVGWDEVLTAGPEADLTAESYHWYGKLIDAASSGRRCLLASGYYLDLMFAAGWHYGVDPTGGEAATLSPEEKALVLGGEASMWGEFVGPENIDTRLWPRAAAIAERLWSPAEVRDEEDMYRRLGNTSRWLEAAGANHVRGRERMIRRLAGERAAPHVKRVADLVEPVKEYARLDAAPCTSSTPLERLVDVAPPESLEARALRINVGRYLEARRLGRDTREDAARLERVYASWRENDEALRALPAGGVLQRESTELSRRLALVSVIASEALRRLEAPPAANGAWASSSLALLEKEERPLFEVMVIPVKGVRPLVAALLEPVRN